VTHKYSSCCQTNRHKVVQQNRTCWI